MYTCVAPKTQYESDSNDIIFWCIVNADVIRKQEGHDLPDLIELQYKTLFLNREGTFGQEDF